MRRHRRQAPPRLVAPGQLNHAGAEHHAKEQPPDEAQVDGVPGTLVPGIPVADEERRGDDAEESHLEQQGVPLEPEERLAVVEEREVQVPHDEEARLVEEPWGPSRYDVHTEMGGVEKWKYLLRIYSNF